MQSVASGEAGKKKATLLGSMPKGAARWLAQEGRALNLMLDGLGVLVEVAKPLDPDHSGHGHSVLGGHSPASAIGVHDAVAVRDGLHKGEGRAEEGDTNVLVDVEDVGREAHMFLGGGLLVTRGSIPLGIVLASR